MAAIIKSDVRKILDALRGKNPSGLLVPEEVVREAEKPSSPLHPWFDWDDGEAAKKWRLEQARCLIRDVEVTFTDDPAEKSVPKYVSLMSDRQRPGGGYRETSRVLSSKELRKELEETAKKELAAWMARYRMLTDLCAKVGKAAGLEGKNKAKR